MKKKDLLFIVAILAIIIPLIAWDTSFNAYLNFNKNHGMITSFIKFAILATLGEVIGLRIKTGSYNTNGFGLFPKAVVWGFLGLCIKTFFIIFATGTPSFLEYLGLENAKEIIKGALSANKVIVAFCISVAMNITFGPVMMIFHKITDIHIASHNGQAQSLLKPIKFAQNFKAIDWNIQWGFVLKKTIPFFWIPAHTITFLMPSDFQVLFAAALSIVLGLILAIASLKSKK